MSDDVKVIDGFVQWEPNNVPGQFGSGTSFKIKSRSSGKSIGITLWSNAFPDVEVSQGDFIIAEGVGETKKWQNKEGEAVTLYNFKPFSIAVVAGHKMQKRDFNAGSTDDDGDEPF